MPGRPKLIYFAERRPELDAASFRTRWRQHARLGMSMQRWSNIYRYVHCDALKVPNLGLPMEWCDGVAIVWYKDEEHRLNHVSDRSAGPQLKADELETFARPVCNFAVLTEEHTLKSGEVSGKLFVRIWRQPDVAPEVFKSWWLEEFGARILQGLCAHGYCQGYWQNHARRDDGDVLCDCVDEFAARDAAELGHALCDLLKTIPEVYTRVRNIKAIWTEETVLYQTA